MRAIQRYGRVSRRSKKVANGGEQSKDPRFMYLSIDEASTHVGSRRFRYLASHGHVDLLAEIKTKYERFLTAFGIPNVQKFSFWVDCGLPLCALQAPTPSNIL